MRVKNFLLRMIPVAVLVIATVAMSLNVYMQMVESEEEICWQRLEVATNSTAGKINTRITDNINFLTTVADSSILMQELKNTEAVGVYLTSMVNNTIFDRIDIILPDDTIITQSGEIMERGEKTSFDVLKEKGAHVTGRLTSSFTGEEIICCVVPIFSNGEISGLLAGTINCETMNKLFEVFTYGKSAQLYLINQADGDYLMDNWHDTFGNVKNLGLRKSAYGDEMIDMAPTLLQGKQARFSFVSQTNGERSFQYCAPVANYNWTVCVVVQEDVVFANLKKLEKNLFNIGIVELLVILVYVLWNIVINITAVKSADKVRKLEYARAKNSARATFISNMSHDIRTPLNGIVGMLQIIKNHRNEKAIVDDCLDKIGISAQYLSTLASDMLDINAIENNKLVLPKESVNLVKLADELKTLMNKQAEDTDVNFSIDLSDLKTPDIIGSAAHIKRVLVNLIGNAIKYSKNAGKCVWVTIDDEAIDGDIRKKMYRFTIKDNGIGMSEEFQKNMYKAFEQEAVTARSEYEGYGLGLTIVNHMVKKMHGTIEIESTKGVGSTFIVAIPFVIDTEGNQNTAEANGEINLSGMKLLLVEDNEFNMEIAKTLLTDAGAVVTTAVNGKLALDEFEKSDINGYDGVIMDIMMPVMDGCEAAKAIRSMDREDAKNIPIIAMTASTFAEDIERCRKAGMNGHVAKPLDMNTLASVITKFVEKR